MSAMFVCKIQSIVYKLGWDGNGKIWQMLIEPNQIWTEQSRSKAVFLYGGFLLVFVAVGDFQSLRCW